MKKIIVMAFTAAFFHAFFAGENYNDEVGFGCLTGELITRSISWARLNDIDFSHSKGCLHSKGVLRDIDDRNDYYIALLMYYPGSISKSELDEIPEDKQGMYYRSFVRLLHSSAPMIFRSEIAGIKSDAELIDELDDYNVYSRESR